MEGAGGGLELGRGDVGEGEDAAAGGEEVGGCETDAAGGAGYGDDFVREGGHGSGGRLGGSDTT